MRSFVVVARKPWGTIPPHVTKLLGQRELPELGFVATDHLLWTSEPGNVVYAGWSGPVQVQGIGAPWHVTNADLTAFTGLMWPKGGMWNDSEPWARQLHTHWQQRPIKSPTQDLDGLYTAVSLSTTGEGHLTTDPLSVAMLYRAETADFVAYSSRATLAARVAAPAGQEPGARSVRRRLADVLRLRRLQPDGLHRHRRASARSDGRRPSELGFARACLERAAVGGRLHAGSVGRRPRGSRPRRPGPERPVDRPAGDRAITSRTSREGRTAGSSWP